MSINRYQSTGFQTGQGEMVIQIVSQSWRKQYLTGVAIEFTDVSHPSHQTECLKKAATKGHLYLTNKQLVWVNKQNDKLHSFSCSFSSIKDFKLKQPMLGANFIKGKTIGEPGEHGFKGSVDWKLTFNDGGAVDYGRTLIQTQKNPPQPAMMNNGQFLAHGRTGEVIGQTFNQPMQLQSNGTYVLPAAGTNGMAGAYANQQMYGQFMPMNSAQNQAPPSYNTSYQHPGVDTPPQYSTSNAQQQPPPPQQYPGQGGDKAREAGF